MNINGLTPSVSAATRAQGARLDITSHALASPERATSPNKTNRFAQMGSIPNVLSEEENQAFATMFQTSRQNVYTSNGTTKTASATNKPGAHFDIRA